MHYFAFSCGLCRPSEAMQSLHELSSAVPHRSAAGSTTGVMKPRLSSLVYGLFHTRGILLGIYRTRQFCDYCKDYHTCTRHFCKFCKTFMPPPDSSLSSVSPPYRYRGHRYASGKMPGCSYGFLCNLHTVPCPEICLSSVTLPARLLDIPVTSVRNVLS